MRLSKKVKALIGIKGFLVVALMISVAAALIAYTASVTVIPIRQLSVGSSTASWTMYINQGDVVRYLPGAASKPTFNSGDTGTYAFKVVTDSAMACAVKVDLTAAMNSSQFSKYQVTIEYWNGSDWVSQTLYAASTGGTTKTFINGLIEGDAGYVQQAISTTRYYLVTVTYSYDLVDETAQVSSTFQYTPLPQTSF